MAKRARKWIFQKLLFAAEIFLLSFWHARLIRRIFFVSNGKNSVKTNCLIASIPCGKLVLIKFYLGEANIFNYVHKRRCYNVKCSNEFKRMLWLFKKVTSLSQLTGVWDMRSFGELDFFCNTIINVNAVLHLSFLILIKWNDHPQKYKQFFARPRKREGTQIYSYRRKQRKETENRPRLADLALLGHSPPPRS